MRGVVAASLGVEVLGVTKTSTRLPRASPVVDIASARTVTRCTSTPSASPTAEAGTSSPARTSRSTNEPVGGRRVGGEVGASRRRAARRRGRRTPPRPCHRRRGRSRPPTPAPGRRRWRRPWPRGSRRRRRAARRRRGGCHARTAAAGVWRWVWPARSCGPPVVRRRCRGARGARHRATRQHLAARGRATAVERAQAGDDCRAEPARGTVV